MKDMRGLYYTLLGTFIIQSLLIILVVNMMIFGMIPGFEVRAFGLLKFLTLSLTFFTQYLVFMIIFLGVALIIGWTLTKKSNISPITAGVIGVNVTYFSLVIICTVYIISAIKNVPSPGTLLLAFGIVTAGALSLVLISTLTSSLIAAYIVKKILKI